jgi:mannan endo-1,4-beta-mannosidase
MNLTEGEASYNYGYPGDGYTDILGLDDYMDVGTSKTPEEQQKKTENLSSVLEIISNLAAKKNKIVALTETGQEGVINPTWYSDVLLNGIRSKSTIHISYALVWRNFSKKHHYAPYNGHSAAADFKKFFDDPYTLFEGDVKGFYK